MFHAARMVRSKVKPFFSCNHATLKILTVAWKRCLHGFMDVLRTGLKECRVFGWPHVLVLKCTHPVPFSRHFHLSRGGEETFPHVSCSSDGSQQGQTFFQLQPCNAKDLNSGLEKMLARLHCLEVLLLKNIFNEYKFLGHGELLSYMIILFTPQTCTKKKNKS